MPKPIETDRLILRPLTENDFDFLRVLHSSPEIMKYIGSGITRTEEQTRVALNKCLDIEAKNPLLGAWVAELKSSRELVGNLIMREPATTEKMEGLEIGYSITVPHWGKGLATEATRGMIKYAHEHFGAIRIVALIEPVNAASRNTLKKVGFTDAGFTQYVDPTSGDVKPTEVLELRLKVDSF